MKNPLKRGRMYKVTGGGAVKGIRLNKSGTVDVLVVPPSKRKNPRPKNKRNESMRKTLKRFKKRYAGTRRGDTTIEMLEALRRGSRKRKPKGQGKAKRKKNSPKAKRNSKRRLR